VATGHTTDSSSTVDSASFDRRTLALISSTVHWTGGVVRYTARGGHLSALEQEGETRQSADTSFGEKVFLDGHEQLLLLGLAAPLAADASFRVPVVSYDGLNRHFVLDTMEVRVTGSGRYPGRGSDSTDVWLLKFGGRQLWVAKTSRRILEKRNGMGDEMRYMRCVAIP